MPRSGGAFFLPGPSVGARLRAMLSPRAHDIHSTCGYQMHNHVHNSQPAFRGNDLRLAAHAVTTACSDIHRECGYALHKHVHNSEATLRSNHLPRAGEKLPTPFPWERACARWLCRTAISTTNVDTHCISMCITRMHPYPATTCIALAKIYPRFL
jgi:hypothetical protein